MMHHAVIARKKATSRLMGLWRFENSAEDSSPQGNDLTAVNAPTYGTSSPPQGTYYTAVAAASDQYFTSSSTDLKFSGSFTTGGWVYRGAVNGSIVKRYDGDPDKGFFLKALSSGAINVGFSSDGSDWTGISTATSLVSGSTWTHIVMVYDGSYIRVYQDGSELTSGDFPYAYSGAINTTATLFKVGEDCNGRLDEIFAYSKALSAAEILYIYNNGVSV